MRQDVSFSFRELNVPSGLMRALPTVTVNGTANNWPGTGTLNVFPAADAFGFAVYEITATDNDPTNPRSTTKTLTITINPINDDPVAYPRARTTIEAVEVDGETTVLAFTANDLILSSAPELPSVEGLFPTSLAAPYDEVEQGLRVVAFQIPGQPDVDVKVAERGLNARTGTGTVTRTTVTGGTLSFTFNAGAFVGGTYTPAINYNERAPFDATDLFSYILSDDGFTTLPGSGYVNYRGSGTDSSINIPERRSAAATVTLKVTEANDPPIFTLPTNLTFDENDGSTIVRTDFVTAVAPAELTARDETALQGITFSFRELNVPAGMMTALPTITVNGSANNWPGYRYVERLPSG